AGRPARRLVAAKRRATLAARRSALPLRDSWKSAGSWGSRGRGAMDQPLRLLDRRIAAASPNSPVPMTISLAPSGTSGSDVTAAVVVATIGAFVVRICATG